MTAIAERILKHAPLYILLQRAVGAHRMRSLAIDLLSPRPGERILDIGCGPAYYLDRFPAVEYYGFDTDTTYIEYARRRWGSRGHFLCEPYSEKHLSQLHSFDGVMLMGLLHHLNDEDAGELLRLVGRALAPGGKVVALDTCFDPTLSKVAHFLARNDRGKFVRNTSAFLELGRRYFQNVDGRVVGGEWHTPSSLFLMSMSGPVSPG